MEFVTNHKGPIKRPMDKAGSHRAGPTVSPFHSNAEGSPDPGVNPGTVPGNCHRLVRAGSIGGLREQCFQRKRA